MTLRWLALTAVSPSLSHHFTPPGSGTPIKLRDKRCFRAFGKNMPLPAIRRRSDYLDATGNTILNPSFWKSSECKV